ncbi:MAG TPA: hypothetical protein VFZ28_01595 [Burkholderiaceae bacterium]|nr:hypothetical protein [Burkholderiaceae bacterium]
MSMAEETRLRCRTLRALPWLLLAWLVSSCGGGTSQIEPFQPRKLIFVGDETVGLLPDGRSYSINGLDTTGAIDCAVLPIWSQQISTNFGLGTDNCKAGTPSITRAIAGGKVADLDAQISAQLAAGVTSKDLFVVMVGMNDIIELYETFVGDTHCNALDNAPPDGSLMAVLRARGNLAAVQISRILDAGARAIVSTVHDLGQTPYAISKGATTQLTCMTAVFNARVRVDIRPQDGRLWGLVLADDNTLAIVRRPGDFGVASITAAACTVALPDCTTATLVSGATYSNYLWADDRHFGPVLQNQLASQAITRARDSPF